MLDDDRLYMVIGQKIKAARKDLEGSLSQQELADRLGVSRTSIVNIEGGKQRPPIHLLWRIAEALGTDIPLLIPSHSEFTKTIHLVKLTEQVREQISEASKGDLATERQLANFVARAFEET